MITNERQYKLTKSAAREFEESLKRIHQDHRDQPLEMRQLMRDAMRSQLEELQGQLAEYEALRSGRVKSVELESLSRLPDALIQGRIASGLTQRELAQRLGLKEQQIQRYEATRYRGVSLERIQEVADALGVKIREHVTFPRTRRTGERVGRRVRRTERRRRSA